VNESFTNRPFLAPTRILTQSKQKKFKVIRNHASALPRLCFVPGCCYCTCLFTATVLPLYYSMNDQGRRRERDEAQDDDLQPPRRRRRIELAINPIPRRLGGAAETVVSFWHFLFLQGRLHDGTYYTTISDLWGTQAARPFNNDLDKNALRRLEIKTALQNCRHVQNGQRTTIDPYNATAASLRDCNFHPKPEISRTSHSNSRTKQVIWPQNILDTSNNGEIAHLLPAGPQDASTWWFIATWLFGGGDRRAMNSWNARMKAIHGYSWLFKV
jgi:hypothetical protein